MGLFSFLGTASVQEISEERKTGRGPKQWNPNPALLAIRVWKDGSIFPSQALVDKFDLQYRNAAVTIIAGKEAVGKEGEEGYVPATPERQKTHLDKDAGNGFDVIDSREWGDFKGDGAIIFISPVKRGEPKIDLFASAKYTREGKPSVGVMDQRTTTFGQETLLKAIEEVYGIKLDDTKEFIDMMVAEEVEGVNVSKAFSKPIIHIPKKIVRGKDIGKSDYERRENAVIYALIPRETVDMGGTTEEDEQREGGEWEEVEQEVLEA